ncbi:MAG: FUSC family protein [Promicromonosporaceae bacterium]|nr:FUSC family protein [Promicromonosporaceae bacterium]
MSSSVAPAPSPVSSAVREVLHPGVVRDALRVRRADATVAAALRVGLAAGVAIVVPALAGHRELSAFAALGALTSLFGRYDTYRRRASVLALVATVMVGAIAVFTLVAALGVPAVATFALMAGLAAGATALVLLLRTGPPGATIVVFCAGAGVAGAPALADLLPRTLAGAGGAALAWVVCMAGVLVRPTAPARLAVRRAGVAVGAALRTGDPASRAAADTALATARAALADDASWRRTRPESLILAEQLRLLTASLHPGTGTRDVDLPERTTLRAQARAALRGPGWRLATARVLAGGLAASLAATALGFGHASWAVMGSTAVLQGATARHMAVRALQRAAGTVVGALAVAYPLLSVHPGFWTTAAVVVVLQVATEVVVGRHYGLAQMLIAPMALLMTTLGAPADPGTLALDRASDTAVGAAAGLVAVLLVHQYRRRRRPQPQD